MSADVERHPIPASATCVCVGFVPASRASYLWIHLLSLSIVVLPLPSRIRQGRECLRGSQRSGECCLIVGSFWVLVVWELVQVESFKEIQWYY